MYILTLIISLKYARLVVFLSREFPAPSFFLLSQPAISSILPVPRSYSLWRAPGYYVLRLSIGINKGLACFDGA